MNITKNKLKQIIAEEYSNLQEKELQETGFQMAPGALESDPEYGEQTTGPEYDYGFEPGRPADQEQVMDLEGGVIEAEPALNIYSMGAPGSEGGPPVATFEEGISFKDTLANMIAEELYESYDHLNEAPKKPHVIVKPPVDRRARRQAEARAAAAAAKAGKDSEWSTWSQGGGYSGPRYGPKGSATNPYRPHEKPSGRRKSNWSALGAGLGGLALGGMAGYMAGGGGQGTGGRQRSRPHPYRRDQGARHMAPQYAGTRYGPPRGAPYPMREPTRMPRGYGGGMAMSDAQDLYDAMKGGGTDEDLIWDVLNANLNPRKMMSLWDAYGRVLQMEDDVDDGNLIDWLEDDGMDGAARAVKMLMNGQAVPYEMARKWADDDA